MICVSLGRPTVEQLLADHQRSIDQGADLVEWRLDYLDQPDQAVSALTQRPGPVIVTCRTPRDGGRWNDPEDRRRDLLREVIAAGPEYVDLEDNTAGAIHRQGNTRRIISRHDFRGTPDDLRGLHAHLTELDADVIKIATRANTLHDSLRVLQMVQSAACLTVGLCMGELGNPTRILAPRFRSAWTYAALEPEEAVAEGQLTLRDLLEVYRYRQIRPGCAVYAVIGDPIAHSRSPQVHNAALAAAEIPAVYIPLRVPAAELPQLISDARSWGLLGLSVTIPHKEALLEYADEADEIARQAGAANTLVWNATGGRQAFNTDIPAALASLESALADSAQQNSPLAGKKVLILGSGGVSRAIAFGLLQKGSQVTVASRTFERSEKLAEAVGCSAVPWEGRADLSFDVLINGTPVGMAPEVELTPFEQQWLPSEAVVFDTIYNPPVTRLIAEARQQGCRTITGGEMFLHQAALQFEAFTGQKVALEVMAAALPQAT